MNISANGVQIELVFRLSLILLIRPKGSFAKPALLSKDIGRCWRLGATKASSNIRPRVINATGGSDNSPSQPINKQALQTELGEFSTV